MATSLVRVRPDYPWTTARVSGRIFSKHGEVLNDELLNEEIRQSTLLLVEPQDAAPNGENPESITIVGEGFRLHADGKAEFDSLTIPAPVEEEAGETKLVEPESIAPVEEDKPKRRGGK